MGVPLMVAQMALQLYGQHEEGKAQQNAYKAQAQAAQQNAAIEAKKAEQIAENYAQKQRSLTDRMRLVRGQAAAVEGASGGAGGGSLANILSASQSEYEKDSANLLRSQRNDVFSSYVNKVNYLNQQSAALTAAENAKAESRRKMFATILGTASSIHGELGKGKQNTPTTTPVNNTAYVFNSDPSTLGLAPGTNMFSGNSYKLGTDPKNAWAKYGFSFKY